MMKPEDFELEMEVDGVAPKLHFNRRDYDQLLRYRQALELVFEHGDWSKIDDDFYWVVPEKYIEEIERLTGDR